VIDSANIDLKCAVSGIHNRSLLLQQNRSNPVKTLNSSGGVALKVNQKPEFLAPIARLAASRKVFFFAAIERCLSGAPQSVQQLRCLTPVPCKAQAASKAVSSSDKQQPWPESDPRSSRYVPPSVTSAVVMPACFDNGQRWRPGPLEDAPMQCAYCRTWKTSARCDSCGATENL